MISHRRARAYLAVRSAATAALIAVIVTLVLWWRPSQGWALAAMLIVLSAGLAGACGALVGVLLGRLLSSVDPGAGRTALCGLTAAIIAGAATAAVVAWCVQEPASLQRLLVSALGLAAALVTAASVVRFRVMLERTADSLERVNVGSA